MSLTSLNVLLGILTFAVLSAALPQSGSCRCNDRISEKGNGECQTTHQGSAYCYVASGTCTDQQESSQAGWFWSFEACKKEISSSSCQDDSGIEHPAGSSWTHTDGCNSCRCLDGEASCTERFCGDNPLGGEGCVTAGGDDSGASCVFPFIYKNQVYNGCTLAGADDGKPWCSTKVDSQEFHVGGEGKWGHCGQECQQDQGSPIGSSTPQKECTCDDHTERDDQGRETGNCLTEFGGSLWCYIDSTSKCEDKKQSSKNPSFYWSRIPCQSNTDPQSVTPEERIRRNEERIRRRGNTTITNRSGSSSCAQSLTSPGYPGKYPRNYGPQETQIRVPDGYTIEITFQHFDVESCYWCWFRKCRWDWVEFKDGNGKVVGERLCGDDLPDPFTIPTSTASISFRSDSSVQTTGYKICYESKPPGSSCDASTWPDLDHGLVCGDCKGLINKMSSKYLSCNNYCNSIGRSCSGAWEESGDTCAVKSTETCAHQFTYTSDAICQCGLTTDTGTCGVENTKNRRNTEISGGTETAPNQYPWMVRLTWGCGGALVTERHVMTAKHCVRGGTDSYRGRKILVGVHNKNNDYQEVTVKEVKWPGSPDDHDFAIIILEQPVDLNDKKIGTVCLPTQGSKILQDYRGEKATAMGWGMTHVGSSQSPVLKHVELTVSQRSTTNFLYTEVGNIAGVPQDPCAGDSGGPLVHKDPVSGRWTIIGTVYGSGFDCRSGNTNGEGLWNKVTAHLAWIESIIQ